MQESRSRGVQAGAAIVAIIALALTVPLFGVLMIPVVALATVGRALVRTAGTVSTLR